MKFEECVVIKAPIANVFGIYADVGSWKKWDPDVQSSTIEGHLYLVLWVLFNLQRDQKQKLFSRRLCLIPHSPLRANSLCV